jgi:hypothetical protein
MWLHKLTKVYRSQSTSNKVLPRTLFTESEIWAGLGWFELVWAGLGCLGWSGLDGQFRVYEKYTFYDVAQQIDKSIPRSKSF